MELDSFRMLEPKAVLLCAGWHGLVLLRFVTRRHLFGACSPAFRLSSQAFFTQEAIDGIVNTTFGEKNR